MTSSDLLATRTNTIQIPHPVSKIKYGKILGIITTGILEAAICAEGYHIFHQWGTYMIKSQDCNSAGNVRKLQGLFVEEMPRI